MWPVAGFCLCVAIFTNKKVRLLALGAVSQEDRLFLLERADLREMVASLMKTARVFGPVAKGKDHVFAEIKDPAEVDLAYQTTILPPKKYLHKPSEVLFSFRDGTIGKDAEVSPQVLFGVHACDLRGIGILDTVFRKDFVDPYWAAKKDKTLVVALNCATIGENCFCQSMNSGPWVKDGYDLCLTPIGDGYLLEVGSAKGKEIADDLRLEPAPRSALQAKSEAALETARHFRKALNTEGLRRVMEDNFRNPYWETLMNDCLGCGSCTMVCPTCFCYNVVDKLELDLKTGRREREWDSCMMLEYAEVALGANFRKDRDARIKQRMYHKLVYYEPQFGTMGCVGCGRCISSCVKKIDLTEVAARLRGE